MWDVAIDLLLSVVYGRSLVFWLALGVIAVGSVVIVGNLFEPSTP